MAEGGTSQDTERKRPSTGHSPTGDGRGGPVRTGKESDRARGTHRLETAEQGTSRDAERRQLSKEHSLPGDGRRMDKSGDLKKASGGHSHSGDGRGRDKLGHGNKVTERGALTIWGQQGE
jgi:hypothetical protein